MTHIRHIKQVATTGLAWLLLTAASTPASTASQIADLLDADKPIEAFALAQEKAGEGDPEAQFALGWFYDSGRHITADKAKAAAQYRKCADKGLSQCQWRLGVMYDIGEGVATDPAAAFAWISKAAAQKNPGALSSLAVMYATGHGTPIDYAKAMEAYKAAADGGEAAGFYGVGILYLEGQGVPKNGEEAAAWFSVGAAVGDEQAKTASDLLLKDQATEVLDRVASRATAIYSEYVAPVQPLPARPTPEEAPKAP